jgi:hypothetical protein
MGEKSRACPPGGPMFVNRRMIEAEQSEGAMAGVIAHESSHVRFTSWNSSSHKNAKSRNTIGRPGGAIFGAVCCVPRTPDEGSRWGTTSPTVEKQSE